MDEKMMRFSDRQMQASALLNKIEQKFQDFRYHNATSLNNYNVKAIRDLIMGLELKRSLSIIAYVDKYYNSAIAPNAQMADGTKRNYRKVLKHLKDFLAFRKSKGAELRDMNVAFAYEFRDYLLGTHPNYPRIGMKEPSALDKNGFIIRHSKKV